jgi:hypothetical protein
MAFTVTVNKKTVFGDMRVNMYSITADATTQTVDTGFDNIVHMDWSAKSMTTSSTVVMNKNTGAEGTALVGCIGISGCTSGDEYYVTVYGN